MPSTIPADIRFRRLWRSEAPLYAAHLRRLQPEDRRARFMGSMDRRFARRHVASIDWTRAVVLGALSAAVCAPLPNSIPFVRPQPPEAEVALTTERHFQDRGLGSELLRRLTVTARNRGIHELHLVTLPENGRIRRIVEKFKGKLEFADGSLDGVIRLAPATLATLLEENFDNSRQLHDRLVEAIHIDRAA